MLLSNSHHLQIKGGNTWKWSPIICQSTKCTSTQCYGQGHSYWLLYLSETTITLPQLKVGEKIVCILK
jgi:hypothetical protein